MYIVAGKITSTYGLKGELLLKSNVSLTDTLVRSLKKESILVKKGPQLLCEGFLNDIRAYKSSLFIICIKSFLDCETANQFHNSDLWVKKNLFKSSSGENIYLAELLDFNVHDKRHGLLGYISDFSDNGAQDILVIKRQSSAPDLDILFIPDFVTHIDFKRRLLFVDLPSHWPGL